MMLSEKRKQFTTNRKKKKDVSRAGRQNGKSYLASLSPARQRLRFELFVLLQLLFFCVCGCFFPALENLPPPKHRRTSVLPLPLPLFLPRTHIRIHGHRARKTLKIASCDGPPVLLTESQIRLLPVVEVRHGVVVVVSGVHSTCRLREKRKREHA
jgi:hypothetical protein